MALLTITRGLPGSGKTTWAKAQPDAWRVNRDDIRAMFTGPWDYSNTVMERLVTSLQYEMIRVLLSRGRHVIVDDTNMRWTDVNALIKLAQESYALVKVKEFLHVPVEVCVERDSARMHPVGREVIMGMYQRYMGEGEESSGQKGQKGDR